MLEKSIFQSRTRELFESSSVLSYDEYHKASELTDKVLKAIEKLIPSEHIEKFKDLVDEYELGHDKTINVFEMVAYKQGLVDGFEIYSLIYSLKK